jgi:hypothetical protein
MRLCGVTGSAGIDKATASTMQRLLVVLQSVDAVSRASYVHREFATGKSHGKSMSVHREVKRKNQRSMTASSLVA